MDGGDGGGGFRSRWEAFVKVDVAVLVWEGRAGEERGWRYMCVCMCVCGESGGGGRRTKGRGVCVCVCVLSRIDQALEEADCATFEDEGTITLLGSVSRRRGSQTTRGKAL